MTDKQPIIMNDAIITYGTLEQMIESSYYRSRWNDEVTMYDIGGRYNEKAWSGRCKPEKTYSVLVVRDRSGIVQDVRSAISDHWRGTYKETSGNLVGTDRIPTRAD